MNKLFCLKQSFRNKLISHKHVVNSWQSPCQTILRLLAPFGIYQDKDFHSIAQDKVCTSLQCLERLNEQIDTGKRCLKRKSNVLKDISRKVVLFHYDDLMGRKNVFKDHVRFYRREGYSGDITDGVFEEDSSKIEASDTSDNVIEKGSSETEENEDENINADFLLEDSEYNRCFQEFCNLPEAGHKVFIIQIELRGTQKRAIASPTHLQLAENEALVHSIPRWSVVHSEIVRVKEEQSVRLMTNALQSVADKIRTTPNVSAVFISRNKLSPQLRVLAHRLYKRPVFDRSFILIQVFKFQAQTKEARLHLALAELPFLRYCMTHGFEPGEYGRPVKRFVRYPFAERERKLQAALKILEKQHVMTRNRRNSRQIPTIAVIGYTNCGKTTLIKALTGDEDMIPRNKLFATLDVTAHGGLLPNNMMVVYMDTVGFLTYLPPNLQGAFTATLEDTLHSDLIIHVRDASHPDMVAQELNVRQSIQKLVPKYKLDTMIEVYNKVDRLEQSERESIMKNQADPNVFNISAVTGEGMEQLRQEVQTRLLQNIDFLQKTLKIPLTGEHLGWLYKESTVVSTHTDDSDSECLIVNVYISKGNYQKFMAHFGRRKATSSKI
ncbi:putative GTP-binding protein 6 [Ruditapes philippinarum]|uniref:putative GTP-binding protein 6 n=1 Tax=Ruditapes philippinarum TaxID=129788 RepID=UPI00295AB4FB|nr:putative GTP-binding protein 6 [Ruditapes philippinarum]